MPGKSSISVRFVAAAPLSSVPVTGHNLPALVRKLALGLVSALQILNPKKAVP